MIVTMNNQLFSQESPASIYNDYDEVDDDDEEVNGDGDGEVGGDGHDGVRGDGGQPEIRSESALSQLERLNSELNLMVDTAGKLFYLYCRGCTKLFQTTCFSLDNLKNTCYLGLKMKMHQS